MSDTLVTALAEMRTREATLSAELTSLRAAVRAMVDLLEPEHRNTRDVILSQYREPTELYRLAEALGSKTLANASGLIKTRIRRGQMEKVSTGIYRWIGR